MMNFDDKIQLILIGESSVGKTSVLVRYTQQHFTTGHLATIGLEYYIKDEKVNDKVIRIKFWDTAGQEQYKSLTRNFYKNSDGIIICFDVSNKESFIKVNEWIESVHDNTDRNIKMILIGNKIDLPREVSKEEGKKLAEQHGIKYFETSAKDGSGIDECMQAIVYETVEGKNPVKDINIKLNDSNNTNENNSKGSCGC